MDLNQRLSTNFTLKEFVRSATAVRKNIDNTPTQEIVDRLKIVAYNLEIIRAFYKNFDPKTRIDISSGYRTKKLNKLAGGSDKSSHVEGWAVDFEVFGFSNHEVCKMIPKLLINYDQVIYEFGEEGWIHLGMGPEHRKEHLSSVKKRVDGKLKTVYLQDFILS